MIARTLLAAVAFTAATTALSAAPAHAGIDLQGIDLQGIDLQGIDLQGVELGGMTVEEFHLDGSTPIGTFRNVATGNLEQRGPLQHRVWTGSGWGPMLPGGLVGARWTTTACDDAGVCESYVVRIAGATPDPSLTTMSAYPDNSDIWLFDIELRQVGTSTWQNLCSEGPDGTRAAMFIRGRWDATGTWSSPLVSLSCTAGVIAKCARQWGYKPWRTLNSAEHGPVPLGPLHRACTRAARADYCGDGTSYTEDETLVDMFDAYGFNVPASDEAIENATSELDLPYDELEIEAFFTPAGAITVNHERYETLSDLFAEDIVLDSCSFSDFESETFEEFRESGGPLIGIRSHATMQMTAIPIDIGGLPGTLP
jgi:ADYC domain-containing protein